MSLILKSNIIATRSLGNINGIKGSQDWLYFADLEGETILKRTGTKVDPVSDTLLLKNTGSINMLAKPITMTKEGVESFVPSTDTLRYLRDSSTGRYGLAAECSARMNYFSNSTNPATQTITLPASPVVIVSVEGTGSLTLTSTNISETYTVTANNPVSFVPVENIAFDLVCTVNGSLTHAQVSRTYGMSTVASRIYTPTLTGLQNTIKGVDNIELQSSIVNELTNSNSDGITIVVQHIPYRLIAEEAKASVTNTRLIEAKDSSSKALGWSIFVDKERGFSTRQAQYDGSIESHATIGSSGTLTASKGVVSAITIKNGELITSCNGAKATTSTTDMNISEVMQIILGVATSTGTSTATNNIITKLALYNKSMSNDELVELSKSWL